MAILQGWRTEWVLAGCQIVHNLHRPRLSLSAGPNDPSRNVLQCSSMHAGLAAHAAMAQSMQGRIRVRLAGCTEFDLQLRPIHEA